MKSAYLLATGLFFIATGLHATTLVTDGRSEYRILVEQQAPESVHEAAAELQRLMHLATGADLAIVTTPTGSGPYIRLGQAAVQAGLVVRDLAHDGFRMRVHGADLLLAGADEEVDAEAAGFSGAIGPDAALQFYNIRRWHRSLSAGTYNAVIEFARRYLRARWYFPGPLGEEIGHLEFLQIAGDLDERIEPRFAMRRFAFTDYDERRARAARNGTDDDYDLELVQASARWGRRLRHTNPIVLGNGHGWRQWIPADQYSARWIADAIDMPLYGAKHPEYFALVDGVRQARFTSTAQHGGQLCVAYPPLRQTYVDNILAIARQQPLTRMFSLAQNDGGQHCECDLCRAWDPAGGGAEAGDVESAFLTDRMLRFQNDIARRVREQIPDAEFTATAYHATGRAPLEQTVDPSIHVLGYYNYLPYRFHLAEKRQELEQAMSGWSRATGNFYFSTFYFAYGNYSLPWSSVDTQRWVIQLMVDNDLRGFNGYYGGGDSRAPMPQMGPDVWLLSQLVWDPEQSADDLVDEWYLGSFGAEAAPHVRAYFAVVDSALTAQVKRFPDFWGSRGFTQRQINLNAYPAIRQRCADLLAAAQAAVATAPERRRWRVEQVMRNWHLVELTLDAIEATRNSRIVADEGALERALDLGQARAAYIASSANRFALSPSGVQYSEGNTPLDILTELPAGKLPSLSVESVTTVPIIDGDLKDAPWSSGAVIDGLRHNRTMDSAAVATHITVLHAADGLYVRARCDEPLMDELVVVDAEGEIWRGDVFEVYLAPAGGEGGYYQFLVNAHGTGATLAHRGDTGIDSNWQPTWKHAGSTNSDSWGVELFIPWESLGTSAVPAVGDLWRAGFFRERYTGERANTAWSPTGGIFAQPHLFGKLVFAP
jgi:hypothetical protein